MNFSVLGINFRTAPVALRERISFAPLAVPAVLLRIRDEFPDLAAVLLSTCNRTELYAAGARVEQYEDRLTDLLLEGAGQAERDETKRHLYRKIDIGAAEHLFAVASGLDSMVVGETEILGQVKQAYALAEEVHTSGPLLAALFQNAFKTAKQVHSLTDINRGRVSVSSIAVEFAEKVFEDLGSKTVLIVGAGETAELSLKSLIERGTRDVLVINRSLERGRVLAESYGGQALPFELLDEYLPRVDIVISSTGAPHIVIGAKAVRRAMEARRGRPVMLIDIAVPRDVDPSAGEIKNVYLYDIDDLRRVADENMLHRQEAARHAWRIVKDATAEAAGLFGNAELRDLLRKIDDYGRGARDAALKKALGRQALAELPEPARESIRALAQRIVNSMLELPREAIKRAAKNGQWEDYARVTGDLFGFGRAEPEEQDDNQDGKKQA